ncbi:MAG: chloride channel protein [Rhodobacteraceae bacterium]|nr:chloride channel protein [Paracoccaceae bacterium]
MAKPRVNDKPNAAGEPQNEWQRFWAGFTSGWALLWQYGPRQVRFWFVALAVGVVSGLAAIGFRTGIDWLQATLYGTDDLLHLHSHAARLGWYWVLLIPTMGGLVVGQLLHRFTDDGRVKSVADVIEAAALYEGKVQRRRGLVSTLASLITLSTGGSTGREGPVVHLASVVASYTNQWMRANGVDGRDLLGCAVAAAVSASFNAPIAGALFALEVVLRHFAIHAFAPIVIASVAGTVLSRLVYGDFTEFDFPVQTALQFYAELPAFMILGLLCGLVAVVQMRAVFWADRVATDWQQRSGLPAWLMPGVSGAMLGAIAIFFPHVIGVGYETTSAALNGNFVFSAAVLFVAVKIAALAITMAGRMGGGIFSPSLMIGALTGLAFGHLATSLVPYLSGGVTLYALAGMGAVAAAVLGAPISTTLIVFELTGDWQAGLAVMVAVSLSVAISSNLVDRSFFLTLLEQSGVHLAAGPQAWLLGTVRVDTVMRATGAPRAADTEALEQMLADGIALREDQTLETAMPLFEKTNASFLPVVFVPDGQVPELRGALFQIDALKALNRALASTAAEEHS